MHTHSHATELTIGLSFILGALHALEPGHGKTAMFVYMLGSRRSIWHPVIMGVSTAISHSCSLLMIASAVHLTHHLLSGDHHHEEHISLGLQWVGALLVVCVGAYLIFQARIGKSCGCGQHHCHQHDADKEVVTIQAIDSMTLPAQRSIPEVKQPVAKHSFRTTAMLGVAVGLLPCPSALAAFFAGLSSGSPSSAYLIVLLFGAGVGCSLSVAGLLLQYFGEKINQRTNRYSHWPWAMIRGSVILAIGLFYVGRLCV